MSWGFFVSLELSMDSADWSALSAKAPVDCSVPDAWPDETDFGQAFRSAYWSQLNDSFQTLIFAPSPGWKDLKNESVRSVEVRGNRSHVRFLVLLDKSQLENAALIATLLYGAASFADAKGKLLVVNDGTGGEENGWETILSDGQVSTKPIEDIWEHVDTLGPELYPEEFA